jgi:tetratricopeptide (TPR) repeat protein
LFDDARSIATAIEEGLTTLGTVPEEPRLRFQLRHMCGRIFRSQGATRPAIDTFRQAVDEAMQDGIAPGPALLELNDALRADGQLPEAMQAAEQALVAFEEPPKRLLAIGRLTQTASALGQHEVALDHAREGLKLAASLDAIGEEAVFKGDEARILLRLNDSSAESAARDFLQLTRQAHDAAAELSAVGVLAGALMARGETVEAETLIDVGLQFAHATRNARSVADFLRDKGRLARLRNNPFAEMQAYLQAAVALAPLGEWRRLVSALGEVERAYEDVLAAPGPAWTATWLKLSAQAGLLPVVPEDIQLEIAVDTIKRLQAVLARDGLDALRDDLREFATEVTALMQLKAPSVLFAQFLIEAMEIFKAVSAARWKDAARLAADLDGRSEHKFSLEQMVDGLARNQAEPPSAD